MTTALDCYKALWELARDTLEQPRLRISSVYYRKPTNPSDFGVGAAYLPSREIVIFRDPSQLPVELNLPADDATLVEAFALAHELGHALSDDRGGRTPPYEAALEVMRLWHDYAIGQCPTPAEQKLVIDEETRAWDLGRDALDKKLGVDNFDEYAEAKTTGLGNYCTRFEAMSAPGWSGAISPEARRNIDDPALPARRLRRRLKS